MAELDSSPRPTWMDDDFLRTCIRNSDNLPSNTPIQIDGVVLKFAVPKGENYMSLMYRISVEYRIVDGDGKVTSDAKNTSFVCKVTHDDPIIAKMSTEFFEKETKMFMTIVPEMQKLTEEKNINTRFICRCLNKITEGYPRVLVLDDLALQGYKVANRHIGLDLKHIKLVLNKLATFHAASRIIFENMDEEQKNQLRGNPFSSADQDPEIMKNFGETAGKTALNIASELSKHGDKYRTSINFLEKYANCAVEAMENLVPYIPDNKFNVICHSDFWVNNMMFRYAKDGSVDDVIFVDLQLCHHSTAVHDFIFFFTTSSDMQVRSHHFDEVKKFYLDSFNATLTQLGYEGDLPIEEEFDEELKRCSLVLMLGLTAFLPIILTKFDSKAQSREESNAFSMDEIAGIVDRPMDNHFHEVVRTTVDVLQERGLLDKFPELPKKERAMGV